MWLTYVLKFDANYHQLQWIINHNSPKKTDKEGKPQWNFWQTEKDPKAKDIDVITCVYNMMMNEEQTDLMRKGLCFWCKKPGHLSCDCPNKKGKTPAAYTLSGDTRFQTHSAPRTPLYILPHRHGCSISKPSLDPSSNWWAWCCRMTFWTHYILILFLIWLFRPLYYLLFLLSPFLGL